ncbi:GNAT family N-acetyltransferase [Parasediminibacterium sp. JCM 36343]|uniref:GNAT family N-acetyltransferase n=1 Tax=Parasediminibacterium sp. JCM 36343 TaxID=3374279 RepID=UPI00397D3DE0
MPTTSNISYRAATKDDFALTLRIKTNALRQYIEEVWGWDDAYQYNFHSESFGPTRILIIQANNTAIGYIETVETETTVHIFNILIEAAYQQKGIGTRILNNILDKAGIDKKAVQLEVLQINTKARQLYERLGFVILEKTDVKYIMVKAKI